VINGEAKDSLLDTYGEERIPIADWLLETTSHRQQVMLAGATSGKTGFDSLSTEDTTQLNLNYHGSSLNAVGLTTTSGLQAGDRAPDVQLADGSWLSYKMRGPEWKLLVFGNEQPARFHKGLHIIKSDDALTQAYGLPDGAVLIRPDGYISLITPNAAEVNTYFESSHFFAIN
jgi:hypothetical protein